MRDGVPLPGSTPAALISQLAHRVFGPLRLDRVRVMVDYHGLAGHPADWQAVVAAHHGITNRTLTTWSGVDDPTDAKPTAAFPAGSLRTLLV